MLTNRLQYLDVSNVDSSFERSFLTQLIPEKYNYLTQILEKQRSRSSFTRDNNHGRVDFSFEIPYDISQNKTNRYNNQVQIKHHKTYVIEVDGNRYHTDLIDDLKDFEIAQLSRTTSHITEDRVHRDVNELIQSIIAEEYIKTIAENYSSGTYWKKRAKNQPPADLPAVPLPTLNITGRRNLLTTHTSVNMGLSENFPKVLYNLIGDWPNAGTGN